MKRVHDETPYGLPHEAASTHDWYDGTAALDPTDDTGSNYPGSADDQPMAESLHLVHGDATDTSADDSRADGARRWGDTQSYPAFRASLLGELARRYPGLDHSDLEDAVSEAVLWEVDSNPHRGDAVDFRDTDSRYTMARVAVRHCARVMRVHRPSMAVPGLDFDDDTPSHEPQPDEAVIMQIDHRTLLAQLAKLPDIQRVALALYYFGGHTLQEIAGMTSVEYKTVKSRLNWGRVGLRARLGHLDPSLSDS